MAPAQQETGSAFRTGYVAIVGEPNVGKSTLINRLVGAKLSIVTSKPQTTRKSVLGIMTTDAAQMIFLDTPGVLTPHYLLQQKMLGYVETALTDCDIVLLMLDANAPDLERLAATPLEGVAGFRKPVVLAINKVDTLHDKKVMLPVMERFMNMGAFLDVIPISAKHGDNVEALMNLIAANLPEGPPLYDPELISQQPQRFFVSELIREQVLKLYKQEIPYSVEVVVVEFKEREAPAKTFISAEIVVERDTQKRIVIGQKGEALKRLGERARANVEEFLEVPVYLELFVKVRDEWRQNENRLRGFGY
ncbi:MAG TPA: GTPase Era [Candidatus Kapabacteria bacterium]|nr:GTPase Era [Candidatus Kapabacteria bacterium]